jgi:hypothetical protein
MKKKISIEDIKVTDKGEFIFFYTVDDILYKRIGNYPIFSAIQIECDDCYITEVYFESVKLDKNKPIKV